MELKTVYGDRVEFTKSGVLIRTIYNDERPDKIEGPIVTKPKKKKTKKKKEVEPEIQLELPLEEEPEEYKFEENPYIWDGKADLLKNKEDEKKD